MTEAGGLDPRCFFAREEMWQAWRRQGERCNLCQRAIPVDLMEGDHMTAWSLGGSATRDNLQALCGSCNLRKGSNPQEVAATYFRSAQLAPGDGPLRVWELEALPLVLNDCERAGSHRGMSLRRQDALRARGRLQASRRKEDNELRQKLFPPCSVELYSYGAALNRVHRIVAHPFRILESRANCVTGRALSQVRQGIFWLSPL
jgi:hypothetical protein